MLRLFKKRRDNEVNTPNCALLVFKQNMYINEIMYTGKY